MKKRILALLLIAAVLLSFCGCRAMKENLANAKQATEGFFAAVKDGSEEDAVALAHPEAQEHLREVYAAMCENVSLSDGCSLEQKNTQVNTHNGLDGSFTDVALQYTLTCGGENYTVYVQYRSDIGGAGLTDISLTKNIV